MCVGETLCQWGGAQLTPWWPSPAPPWRPGTKACVAEHKPTKCTSPNVVPMLVLAQAAARKEGQEGYVSMESHEIPRNHPGGMTPAGPWQPLWVILPS